MQLITRFEDENLLRVTAIDDIGTANFRATANDLEGDERFHEGVDVLLDVRPLERPLSTIDECLALGRRLVELVGEIRGRVALVAPPGEAQQELWGAAAAASEAGVRISIFDSESRARIWLADQSRRYLLTDLDSD